ncbi:MAG TPA: hypothetical protein VHA52_12295 [Candidatus Babeliaceae bacterium]|nr:hypothetical protein [Candidatus Babeliaceae bacterium]
MNIYLMMTFMEHPSIAQDFTDNDKIARRTKLTPKTNQWRYPMFLIPPLLLKLIGFVALIVLNQLE